MALLQDGECVVASPAGVISLTTPTNTKEFVYLVAVAQILLIIGFGCLAKPTSLHYKDPVLDAQLYNILVGVSLMMFVGFGYLMTFLRWYGLGAVGFTMLVTCLGMQVALLVEPLYANGFQSFELDLMAFLNADFAVAAFLISFGGLIGKVNPSQLVVLTCFESIFYCANKQLLLTKWLNIVDCGGTIIIHMFGAYFGLTVAKVIGVPHTMTKETSSTVSDVFSLVGTVFLWLYWPSFVGGSIPAGTVESETALTNTILALLGSTVTTFAVTAALNSKMLSAVDIQNATLAGGVSIGAIANLNIQPCGALIVGCVAGMVSAVGYNKVQTILLNSFGLHDSCGIHNLHGMPSLLGGIASVVVPIVVTQGEAGALGKPGNQLLGISVTLVMAIASGGLTGLAMKSFQEREEVGMDDSMFWTVADDFDKAA